MKSLLENANQVAHEEAKKEAYSIGPMHVERVLEPFPEILDAVRAMPKMDKKKSKKKMFQGEEMKELIAAQNALFDQAKAKMM
ncbi:hypothetical protein THRCLA_22243 [Thraustotheca clavata]|uniref:Uncharacterized protein n=1 Tax=Thraustotheca clavata TaxID=74557 RepID=A0A1V9Z8Z3_9STRA|nr:hypothetical protein THRCLA_22243 [Thraustotheca clavata]